MSKIKTQYTISWSNGVYTITWASTYDPVSFASDDSVLIATASDNLFLFGTDETLTTLDWTKETSLSAVSRSDLFTKINALATELISESGGTVTVNGDLDVTGALDVTGTTTTDALVTTASTLQVRFFGNLAVLRLTGDVGSFTGTKTITIPIPSGSTANFVIDTGASTLTGARAFSDGITFGTSGGTASNLNYYEIYTESGTFSLAGGTSTTQTLRFVRLGNSVICLFPDFTMTAGATVGDKNLDFSVNIPSRLRPVTSAVHSSALLLLLNATTYTSGVVKVDTAGLIQVYKGDISAFTASQDVRVHSAGCFWSIV